MSQSAYVFKELEKNFGEGKRLSAQAEAFVEIELPGLLKRIPSNAKVADFGCGTGVISAALAMGLSQGQVLGLEPDEKALELAQKQGQGISNLSFQRYGFGEEGLPAGAPFDVAFTRLVLLHLPDPLGALRQMGRCLKPGGLLYVVDCDDDYIDFSPQQPWQAEIVALMKQGQALRGGTRTLGSQLLKKVTEAGFWPEGSEVMYYSTENLGLTRWKEIFIPALGGMARRDLDYLVGEGKLEASRQADLIRNMEAFFSRQEVRAQLSTWHVWARKA